MTADSSTASPGGDGRPRASAACAGDRLSSAAARPAAVCIYSTPASCSSSKGATSVPIASPLASESDWRGTHREGDRVEGINTVALPRSAYDLIFSCHSFHHFEALEHVMQQAHDALTPGGLFVPEEFVGPTQVLEGDLPGRGWPRRRRVDPERLPTVGRTARGDGFLMVRGCVGAWVRRCVGRGCVGAWVRGCVGA